MHSNRTRCCGNMDGSIDTVDSIRYGVYGIYDGSYIAVVRNNSTRGVVMLHNFSRVQRKKQGQNNNLFCCIDFIATE